MMDRLNRSRAAALLSRQSGSLPVPHYLLRNLELNDVFSPNPARHGKADYGAAQLLQARVALVLYDFGITSAPILKRLVKLVGTGKREAVLNLKGHDGAAFQVRLPIQRYEREINAALDAFKEVKDRCY